MADINNLDVGTRPPTARLQSLGPVLFCRRLQTGTDVRLVRARMAELTNCVNLLIESPC